MYFHALNWLRVCRALLLHFACGWECSKREKNAFFCFCFDTYVYANVTCVISRPCVQRAQADKTNQCWWCEWCTFNMNVSVAQTTASSIACTRMRNHRRGCHWSTTLFPDPVKLCTVCTWIFSELVKCIHIRIACTAHAISVDGKLLPTAVSCTVHTLVAASAFASMLLLLMMLLLMLNHRQAYFPENSIYISHRTIGLPYIDESMLNTSFRFCREQKLLAKGTICFLHWHIFPFNRGAHTTAHVSTAHHQYTTPFNTLKILLRL